MLIRLVKMTFHPDNVDMFKAFFDEQKNKIREFEGCAHLELWQDAIHPNIFFTYSRWNTEAALAHYRNSAFFTKTWQQTKQMFAAKAEAWSVNQIAALP